jgi:hypothetical protein
MESVKDIDVVPVSDEADGTTRPNQSEEVTLDPNASTSGTAPSRRGHVNATDDEDDPVK